MWLITSFAKQIWFNIVKSFYKIVSKYILKESKYQKLINSQKVWADFCVSKSIAEIISVQNDEIYMIQMIYKSKDYMLKSEVRCDLCKAAIYAKVQLLHWQSFPIKNISTHKLINDKRGN